MASGAFDSGVPDGAGIGTEQSPQKLVAVALKRERTRAGLSLSEVARRADIAKSTLSQLESGLGNPSLETLWALGNALGVPFSQLVDSQAQTVQLIRAGEGPAIASANASYIATLLAPSPPNARRDLYRIVAEPGEPRISTPHARGTTEHVVIGTGRAEVGPTAGPIELGPGDYLAYPGDEEHIFRALEPGTTAILVSEHT
ncbi:helix-turn-helix domain-containing protein [Rhodococcus erythropolis]